MVDAGTDINNEKGALPCATLRLTSFDTHLSRFGLISCRVHNQDRIPPLFFLILLDERLSLLK